MHLVRITDPWFGPYIRVSRSQTPGSGPMIIIGPLHEYTIRMESLHNQGRVIRNENFTEKPCTHLWVEGTVSGELPEWTQSETDWTLRWAKPGPYEFTVLGPEPPPDPDGSPAKWAPEHSWKIEWAEDEHYVDASIKFVSGYRHNKNSETPEQLDLDYQESFAGSIRYLKSVDEITGSVSYRVVSVTRVDEDLDGIAVEDIPPPFGTGGVLGSHIRSLYDYIRYAMESVDLSDDNGQRDAAIYDALDNIQLADINPLECIADLLEPLQPIRKLAALLRGPNGLMGIIRKLSSLHLMWKYVVKTNLMDAKEIHKLMHALSGKDTKFMDQLNAKRLIGHGESSKSMVSKDGSETIVRHSAKLVYGIDISSFDGMLDLLNILGLTPRIADLWDIVPLSFVLDWVFPIGDAIDNMEMNSTQQRLPFIYAILSKKVQHMISRSFVCGDHNFTLDLKITFYTRTTMTEFPADVWFGVGLKDPRRQLLTGGALLVTLTS